MNDVPRKLKPAERRKVEDEIERLIGLLDTTDTNPDDEPSLGWPNALGPQQFGSTPGRLDDDREDDGDDLEPDEDGEFSLGWENEHSQAVLRDSDEYEPELGTTEEIDQVRRLQTLSAVIHDGEPDLGWVETHGSGVRPGETTDDREGDDEREGDNADAEPFLGWSEAESEYGAQPSGDEFPRHGNGPVLFRGEGYQEAREALRELNRKNPPTERAERLPNGVILRTFSTEPPPDDDWRLMHYRAANERPKNEGGK